jgi:hypothetical protein
MAQPITTSTELIFTAVIFHISIRTLAANPPARDGQAFCTRMVRKVFIEINHKLLSKPKAFKYTSCCLDELLFDSMVPRCFVHSSPA